MSDRTMVSASGDCSQQSRRLNLFSNRATTSPQTDHVSGFARSSRGVSIRRSQLNVWAESILRAAGASREAAAATARALTDANLRGLDTHGVALLRLYVERLLSGAVDGKARLAILTDLPGFALIDGKDGLGTHVATLAMQICCDKAQAAGAAVVVVRRSSHFGAASYYAELAAERRCIGIVMSNSDPGMAPSGAMGPILGTNPISIAAPPSGTPHMPTLDIATSVVAQGRIIQAGREGRTIPSDWAIGPDGLPTVDPARALAGAVLPMAGHKGFGLAFMIDVLAGGLSGALVSPDIKGDDQSGGQGTGHCFIAIHVPSVRSMRSYKRSVSRLTDAVHEAPRRADVPAFMIPGEREAKSVKARRTAIPIDGAMVGVLRELGQKVGVAFPA